MGKERREHPRYNIGDLVIAVHKKDRSQIARILNISRGGIAVMYTGGMEWLGEAEEIDIIFNSTSFLTDIPISSVADFEAGSDSVFATLKERHACLMFGELSDDQKTVIDSIIDVYKDK
jgi:hypothetical protein